MERETREIRRLPFKFLSVAVLSILSLLIALPSANANQVITGQVSNAEYLIGAKYRSFGNTPNSEIILGTLLPNPNPAPTNGDVTWSKDLKNHFKFTYDPETKLLTTVIFQFDPTPQPKPVTMVSGPFAYPIPDSFLNLDRLTLMRITLVYGDANTKVALKNVKLNGNKLVPYDDFFAVSPSVVTSPSPQKFWTVKGFDFKNGFVLTGEIVLTGNFGTDPDKSSISLDVGYKLNNSNPRCDVAYPNPDSLWPPNHDFHPIDIKGVSDQDGDSVSLLITKILQDEPINAQGDGNTVPDGLGIGAHKTWLRSERAGGGDGRVYHVYFTADDGFGGTCKGEVKVGVPKSQGANGGPVDGGPIYNSTLQSASFFPKFLRFLYQEVGTTSIRQIVTMTNITPEDIDLSAFTILDPFEISTNDCPATLLAGDSCTFAVTFTPASKGIFKGAVRITSSAADSPYIIRLWGMGGYLPLPESQGIFRDGDWFFDRNKNLGWDGFSIDDHKGKFGGSYFDIPVMGDWNGDGEKEIGIYRRGAWYLDNGNGVFDGCGQFPDRDLCIPAFGGFPWDIPVVGDWNGDGKTNIGIYRNGAWYLDKNGNGIWDGCDKDACLAAFGGLDVDKPLIGDWDGSGISRIGIYREGLWYLDMNGNGSWDGCDVDACIGPFGGFDMDKPVIGDWKGDGIGRIGIYRHGLWYMDLNGNGQWDGCEIDLCAPAFGGFSMDHPLIK